MGANHKHGPTDDGWIPWAGGECPVEGHVRVVVCFRDGREYTDAATDRWDWSRFGRESGNDIVAYRIEQPAQRSTAPAPEPFLPSREEVLPPVERIEMVSYETGYKQEAEPMWRVQVSGYCTDFETEAAANNFRNAILDLLRGRDA